MINSRKIEDLTPEMKDKCYLFIQKCKEAGITVIVTSTYRDFEYQNDLYAQGRTKPGKKVTNAKAGYSMHNFRLAFDFVPIIKGKAQWEDMALWQRCGKIAVECGLDWGGYWTSFKDMPHCQEPGQSLEELRRKYAVKS